MALANYRSDKIIQVVSLELDATGELAALNHMKIVAAEMQSITEEHLLVNTTGELLILRLKVKTQNELEANSEEPKFIKGYEAFSVASSLSLCVGTGAQFAFTGRFMCWQESETSELIRIYDLRREYELVSIDLNQYCLEP